jgi:hypothetical protein
VYVCRRLLTKAVLSQTTFQFQDRSGGTVPGDEPREADIILSAPASDRLPDKEGNP